MQVARQTFYEPESLYAALAGRLKEVEEAGEAVNYVSFVPDGEPTLDANLGKHIELAKSLGVKTAVISNASLLMHSSVRDDLSRADLVSLKMDAVSHRAWRRINRPHGQLNIDILLDGALEFSRTYSGTLVSETQVVSGINDSEIELTRIARFLDDLRPAKAYVATPTRPPAERWVKPANERALDLAYQMFTEVLGQGKVEYLIGYEGTAFTTSKDFEDALLSITAVHPMRRDAVQALLDKKNRGWDTVKRLIESGKLAEVEYQGNLFYVRRLSAGR